MPSPPYAKLLITVNGGAPQTGGIVVQPGDVVQLSGESTAGWRSARWELYAYPFDWTVPSGWTLDAETGLVVSTDLLPAAISVPGRDVAWGKWLPRLVVNGASGDRASPGFRADLVDDASGWQTLSTNGLRDLGSLEDKQFDALRGWPAEQMRNVRQLDQLAGIGATLTTVDATDTTLAEYAMPAAACAYVQGYVVGRAPSGDAAYFAVDDFFGRNAGGALVRLVGSGNDLLSTRATTGAMAWGASLVAAGNNVELHVHGAAATTVKWHALLKTVGVAS